LFVCFDELYHVIYNVVLRSWCIAVSYEIVEGIFLYFRCLQWNGGRNLQSDGCSNVNVCFAFFGSTSWSYCISLMKWLTKSPIPISYEIVEEVSNLMGAFVLR
jgi:hypothetical protein